MSLQVQIDIDRLEKAVVVMREDIDRLVKVIDRLDMPRGPGRPKKEPEAA